MSTKRFVVEMDDTLANLLKNTGQMTIVEAFEKDYDGRGSIRWEVFAGDRCEYEGWSKDAAVETYSKFLAYSRGAQNHPAYNKSIKIMKDGEIYMERKAPSKKKTNRI